MKLSPAAREIMATIRRHRLSYDMLRQATLAARKATGLKRPSEGLKLPRLLTEAAVRKFFESVDRADNLQHRIMFRLFVLTGIRVNELVNIRMEHVDASAGRIFIQSGKGDKDRYVLFRDDLKLALKAYMDSRRDQGEYLFESTHNRPYSTERIRQITRDYAAQAGITERVHPHAFRHYFLTQLTKAGMTDAQIQVVSGHASKDSLAVYQHLSLEDIRPGYREAMKGIEI